jgi:hypothetical protein
MATTASALTIGEIARRSEVPAITRSNNEGKREVAGFDRTTLQVLQAAWNWAGYALVSTTADRGRDDLLGNDI